MLRRNMLVVALVGMAAVVSGASMIAFGCGPANASEQSSSDAKPLIVARSCASECQSQHDRCRVETKGSRTCDEIRQRCLQVCLQKKKK